MSTPGWYADPDGTAGLRYFDGRQWTPHISNPPVQSPGGPPQAEPPHSGPGWGGQGAAPGQPYHQPAQFQQYQGPGGGRPPTATKRRNVLLWVAVGVFALLVVPVGFFMLQTWLLTSSAPGLTEFDDIPQVAPGEFPPVGTVVEPVTGCPATATDARGELNAEGRFASGSKFSMPATEGFVGTPVQYPWVHGSNSQAKQYDSGWMSSFTVGELRADDGFTDTTSAAIAVVRCMLGSERYTSVDPTALGIVIGNEQAPEGDGVKLFVDVPLLGAPGETTDKIYVMVVTNLDTMHVLITTVPAVDALAKEARNVINMDMQFDDE